MHLLRAWAGRLVAATAALTSNEEAFFSAVLQIEGALLAIALLGLVFAEEHLRGFVPYQVRWAVLSGLGGVTLAAVGTSAVLFFGDECPAVYVNRTLAALALGPALSVLYFNAPLFRTKSSLIRDVRRLREALSDPLRLPPMGLMRVPGPWPWRMPLVSAGVAAVVAVGVPALLGRDELGFEDFILVLLAPTLCGALALRALLAAGAGQLTWIDVHASPAGFQVNPDEFVGAIDVCANVRSRLSASDWSIEIRVWNGGFGAALIPLHPAIEFDGADTWTLDSSDAGVLRTRGRVEKVELFRLAAKDKLVWDLLVDEGYIWWATWGRDVENRSGHFPLTRLVI